MPSIIFARSTTPTMQPARSYSPRRYIPGICAVSPPIKAQPPARQALVKPRRICSKTARLEFLRADVIEKEERPRAEDRDVVDAVIDEIGADGVVPVHRKGDLQLRPDAVDAARPAPARAFRKNWARTDRRSRRSCPSTSGPCVCLTSPWILRFTRLPRSTSTPARA